MKQLLTVLVILSITSVLFISCNDKTSESGTNTATEEKMKSFDLAAAKKVIDSTNAAFGALVAKSDSVGLASFYTSDGKMMGSNMPTASGRSQIQSAFGGLFAAMGPINLNVTIVDAWGNDDLIAEEGTYTMNKDGKEIDRGKYIVLWKMENGKWKMFRDIFNSDNPPPPTPSK